MKLYSLALLAFFVVGSKGINKRQWTTWTSWSCTGSGCSDINIEWNGGDFGWPAATTKRPSYRPTSKPKPQYKPPSGSSKGKCGKTPIHPTGYIARIIGGRDAKPYSWPWQIFLKVSTGGSKYNLCGGSLIARKWVLTASHCLGSNPRVSDVTVYAGLFKQQEWVDGRAQTLKVAKYYRNPKYTASGRSVDGQDIALIKLKNRARFNKKVQPVCLPKKDSAMTKKGAEMTVTGWGKTSINADSTNENLKQLTISNVGSPGGYCETKDEICAPGRQSGTSFYSGDSGGPLVRKKEGRWYQYGIVSGWKHWSVHDITVFARVSVHCKWIRKITRMNICR